MDTFQISILILQIINIVFSICVGPLVTAVVELTRRIERSNCCGSNVELTHIDEIRKTPPPEFVEQKNAIDEI